MLFNPLYFSLEPNMNKFFSHKYDNDIINLLPGEFEVSNNEILSTILGTCISVVLISKQKQIAGMNHFMLPKCRNNDDIGVDKLSGKYGVQAMELLVNAMMKKGVKKGEMVAKVFGGGSMFRRDSTPSSPHVGLLNIDFAVYYLEEERIPIISQDTGGAGGRKIYLFPKDGKVILSKVGQANELMEQENSYSLKISGGIEDHANRIVLF